MKGPFAKQRRRPRVRVSRVSRPVVLRVLAGGTPALRCAAPDFCFIIPGALRMLTAVRL